MSEDTDGHVLDLPLEEQKRIARDVFKMEHAEWVEMIKRSDAKTDEFIKELDANKGIRPEGWTDEDTKRFQKKIDSSNPPPDWKPD